MRTGGPEPGALRVDKGVAGGTYPGSCSVGVAATAGRRLRFGLRGRDVYLARREVDLGSRVAEVALADAIIQVNDAMAPRVVLRRELAELRVYGKLVAEPLVEPLHLIALLAGQFDGLAVLAVG